MRETLCKSVKVSDPPETLPPPYAAVPVSTARPAAMAQVKLPLRDREEEYGALDWDAVSAFYSCKLNAQRYAVTTPYVLYALENQKPASNHKPHERTLQL